MRVINLFTKRIFDIFGSVVGLIILLPLMIIISISIKLTSKGPFLFKQKRLGMNGKVFKILKFITMVVNAEDIGRTKYYRHLKTLFNIGLCDIEKIVRVKFLYKL